MSFSGLGNPKDTGSGGTPDMYNAPRSFHVHLCEELSRSSDIESGLMTLRAEMLVGWRR